MVIHVCIVVEKFDSQFAERRPNRPRSRPRLLTMGPIDLARPKVVHLVLNDLVLRWRVPQRTSTVRLGGPHVANGNVNRFRNERLELLFYL